jgi:hypothetical protein
MMSAARPLWRLFDRDPAPTVGAVHERADHLAGATDVFCLNRPRPIAIASADGIAAERAPRRLEQHRRGQRRFRGAILLSKLRLKPPESGEEAADLSLIADRVAPRLAGLAAN